MAGRVSRPPIANVRWSARRLSFLANHLRELASATVDADGAEPAAPDAAGVETEQVVALDQSERRPVTEGDRHAGGAPARHVEPAEEPGRRCGAAVLGLKIERAVGGDE